VKKTLGLGGKVMKDIYEIYNLTSTSVHEKLKAKVKGRNHVYVDGDSLIIQIHTDEFEFERSYSDYLHYVILGMSLDDIVDDVVKSYKKFVVRKFFYN
jgi:hypothetical protein